MKFIEDLKKRQNALRYLHSPAKDEIYTPLDLAREMLDKLPSKVWKNPELKWLDPACKTGVFLSEVIIRLFEGLRKREPNDKKRYNHIIKNMIYGYAFSEIGALVTRKTLYNNFGFEGNIKLGLFIKEDIKMKFDIIVGNPPYQAPQESNGKRGGGDHLWNKFVEKSFELVNKNGFLVFVHPASWRKPKSEHSKTNKIWYLMKASQVHYLEIHNTIDGQKTFGAGTRYDWYILENTPVFKPTTIKDENGKIQKIDLKEWPFIPNFNFDVVEKILAKENEETCPIIFNVNIYETRREYTSENKDNKFKYPLIHSIIKNGIRYYYSSRNDLGHFGIPKVIFSDGGINDVIIDIEGKYGMTQHSLAIQVESLEEAENIKKGLLSDKFQKLLKSIIWSNFMIDYRTFKYFKKDFWKEFIDENQNPTNS